MPVGTIEKYKDTWGWKKFVFVEEGTPSCIRNIKNEGKNEKRYTKDGKVINSSHKGVNIIHMSNGKTSKVLVK